MKLCPYGMVSMATSVRTVSGYDITELTNMYEDEVQNI